MKNIKILFILAITVLFSCDDKEFLEEVPLSIYTPENSFITPSDFEAGINNLYHSFRLGLYTTDNDFATPPRSKVEGTDLTGWSQNAGNYPDQLTPTSGFVYSSYWQPAYKIIYQANVIVGYSDSEEAELTEQEKLEIQAEARFFRGYMFKLLANFYGGVPIVLEETKEPKRDYVRASRAEVYEQSVADLKFAAENLPGISEVASYRISNLVAYHALAEAYICLKQWDNAIQAASVVIDDPNTSLMTERFGARMDDEFIPEIPWANGGDVYWDLFRDGNFNRSAGNTEALWVVQFDYYAQGGSNGGTRWETWANPQLYNLQVLNNNGKAIKLIPSVNTYYGGRGNGHINCSEYFLTQIWNDSGFDQDIRNSDHNIIRDFKVNNPASDHHGKWIYADNLNLKINNQNRVVFPLIAKVSSMGDHPKDLWLEDQTVVGSMISQGPLANTTYHDEYQIRLAETYLVRAEAYLGKNDLVKAAADINVIRSRAQAPAIEASDVDLDYILDERARELYGEENRMETLLRLGLLVERNNKYNPQFDFYDHQNLWPIPFGEIEKNTEAVLEQNPGY
ncbi:RagB/SusD family nutrient uptake outer membrane protein [Gaoshiqia sediminis]|uniref:RagB/SusD family nutrient uptake outer membrane protein n=1 Tax=Gaoshiqia sediminis TaxID=2986998 RepID=A0AA42CAS5_9BACT|nr:RagB/SusD family nutrient uptake outer membrane protein [Gaoshiqia sediminis]MCW0483935.1 RagB/SusD family nutrient uptake outer membrane protein [Gaoshiqia sediminis]